eukprot:TRINITY_DN7779_c0_g1_i1.p1 TRINITY_DN7779_c0_g1~~TRINITY_DN7779_c0_g1_i1.p1  ORF type:complete len:263 (+),score=23.40 TRINITY_DN7779_c0_g1_i1:62-850(+)
MSQNQVCPWTGNIQEVDDSGNRIGPSCPFMSKESGMEFEAIIFGGKSKGCEDPLPHSIRVKGYPPNLSVLDFIELVEAGNIFAPIELDEGLTWSQMVVRKDGEPQPLGINEILNVEKGGRIYLEPKEFPFIEIEIPNRKKPFRLHNLPKHFTVKDLKLSFVLYFQIPLSEQRTEATGLYRKSDLTFSNPIPNQLKLYQLSLPPGESLVFNYVRRPLPTREESQTPAPSFPLVGWIIIFILISSVIFVTSRAFMNNKAVYSSR